MTRAFLNIFGSATALLFAVAGCARTEVEVRETSLPILGVVEETGAFAKDAPKDPEALVIRVTDNVVGTPPPTPLGAVPYCWEEPIVDEQVYGPGLGPEKRFYYPAHIAVHQVRGGKWRPCQPVREESKGEVNYER